MPETRVPNGVRISSQGLVVQETVVAKIEERCRE
jgi:hypothetical protein